MEESKKREYSCIGELFIEKSRVPVKIPTKLDLKFHVKPNPNKLVQLQVSSTSTESNATESRIVSGFIFDGFTKKKDGTPARFAKYKAVNQKDVAISRMLVLRESELNERLMGAERYAPFIWVESNWQ